MSYTLVFSPRAMSDLQKIKKSGNQALIKKLKTILGELQVHPYEGTGKPEQLKNRPNTFSRRLSQKDRIVYSVHENIVQVNILQMLKHYCDK